MNKYELLYQDMSTGAFGTVYRGVWTQYNDGVPLETDVAIKSLKCMYIIMPHCFKIYSPANPSSDEIEEFISESAIMLDFDHPNVLSLLGVCFDTEQQLPLIILPYMANGDLKSYLLNRRGDNEPNILPDVSILIYYTDVKNATIIIRACLSIFSSQCVLILLEEWNIWPS